MASASFNDKAREELCSIKSKVEAVYFFLGQK